LHQSNAYNILIIPCTEWLKGSQQRLHHLSKEWSKKHKIYVLYLERQDNILNNKIFSDRLQYSNMIKIPTLKLKNYTLFLLSNFLLQTLMIPRVIKRNKIHVIVAEGLGPSNIASIASRLMNRRFIFDYSDSYSAFVSSYISNVFIKKILEVFATILTNINVKLSSATVVVSDGLLDSRANELKQYKIVNGVSEDYFPFGPSRSQSTSGSIVITFVGAVESWVNFKNIIDAIEELNKVQPKFILKVVGDGLKLREVKDLCIQKGLNQSAIFTGWVPYEKIHEQIQESDICILPFDNSAISSLSMPMKIHEYAISKKPIISTPLPEIKKIYGSSVMYATSKGEYIHAIGLLLDDEELRLRQIEQAYAIAKNYSWACLAEKYTHLLRSGVS
jgi:glycosyltransferase involved in cell wall biosynthesis